ncbi:hypothetical protein K9O30_22260 [Clostridium bowmanii]|nr:hypothetical protein [Clostridium bowmanii]
MFSFNLNNSIIYATIVYYYRFLKKRPIQKHFNIQVIYTTCYLRYPIYCFIVTNVIFCANSSNSISLNGRKCINSLAFRIKHK